MRHGLLEKAKSLLLRDAANEYLHLMAQYDAPVASTRYRLNKRRIHYGFGKPRFALKR